MGRGRRTRSLCDDFVVAESETLGVLAHPGGLVVERPELSVGVLRAISRPDGLEIELLARRPPDRRSALERQADIRAGRDGTPTAPRRLLPAFDEGMDLRVGWLDGDGRAHWEFATRSMSGDYFEHVNGPSLRLGFDFPALFGDVSMVLAWPEIGFEETVVSLALPDRATVERDTVSIWTAPFQAGPVPDALEQRVGAFHPEELAVETGRVVAAPRVLSRGDHAVVVLTGLTAVGSTLIMEIQSVARDEPADTIAAAFFPPSHPPPEIFDDPEELRARGPGASVAVVQDGAARWLDFHEGSTSGGDGFLHNTAGIMLSRPDDGVLDLVVAWPAAGLADVRVTVPLSQH